MTRTVLIAAATAASIFTSAFAAEAEPNLRPGFNVKTGVVTVMNIGAEKAEASLATVECNTTLPGGCPDPTAAMAAPYENPAFPNAASIKFKPIPANSSASHQIGFFKSLNFAPGTYVFTVCVDAAKQVAESSEGDNCRRFRKSIRKRGGKTKHLTLG